MNLVSRMGWQHPIFNQTEFYHRPEQYPTQNLWLPQSSLGSGPALTEDVKVELQNRKLWSKFHAQNTEMIITKSGRRMFPSMQISVSGLQKKSRYFVLMEIIPATNRRHKYVIDGSLENIKTTSRGWTTAGPAEPQPPQNRRIFVHPEGPATGAHWMQHPINFNKLKITNNSVDPHSHVILTSMHKYIPKIWIIRCDDHDNLMSQPCMAFSFPETEFIAVTAYQNENITKLKINNNPFAKGFRETGQSRSKRKLQISSQDQSLDLSQDSQDDEGNVSSSNFETHEISESKRIKRSPSETGSVIDDSGISSSGGTSPPLSSESLSESNFRVSPPPEHHSRPQARLHRPWDDSASLSRLQESTLPTVTPLQYHSLFYPLLAPHQHLSALEYSRLQQIQNYQSSILLNKFYF